MPVPVAVPGVLSSIGWVLLLSPQIGVINNILRWLFDLEEAPINVYSLAGMIFLEGLHLILVTFLMMAGAFRRMDPALEEASTVAGGGILGTLWRVTLRVLLPSIINGWIFSAIAVGRAIGSVIMLYSPSTIVVPVMVWELWNNGEVPATAALGVMIIIFLIAATALARKLSARSL